MENQLIYQLTETFEGHAQQTDSGVEYWLARDLQYLLGYTKWDNFLNVIAKAKRLVSCLVTPFPTILPTSGKWSKSPQLNPSNSTGLEPPQRSHQSHE